MYTSSNLVGASSISESIIAFIHGATLPETLTCHVIITFLPERRRSAHFIRTFAHCMEQTISAKRDSAHSPFDSPAIKPGSDGVAVKTTSSQKSPDNVAQSANTGKLRTSPLIEIGPLPAQLARHDNFRAARRVGPSGRTFALSPTGARDCSALFAVRKCSFGMFNS